MEDTIGIDISKDKLDANWLSKGEHKQFDNDKAGVAALALWANGTEVSRVIFESTGIYHRGMKFFDFGFVVLNPPDLIGKHACQPINGLPFPRRHLCRMNLVLRCNLLRRLVTTQRLERHRSFELV